MKVDGKVLVYEKPLQRTDIMGSSTYASSYSPFPYLSEKDKQKKDTGKFKLTKLKNMLALKLTILTSRLQELKNRIKMAEKRRDRVSSLVWHLHARRDELQREIAAQRDRRKGWRR